MSSEYGPSRRSNESDKILYEQLEKELTEISDNEEDDILQINLKRKEEVFKSPNKCEKPSLKSTLKQRLLTHKVKRSTKPTTASPKKSVQSKIVKPHSISQNIQIQIDQPNARISNRSHSKNAEKTATPLPVITRTITQDVARTSHEDGEHTHIVERHNFARELQIEVKNDNRPITQVERHIVDNFEQSNKAPQTRIITLNNKNVPPGVHLAIAVDKSKYLSKNALKKITRNLASQM